MYDSRRNMKGFFETPPAYDGSRRLAVLDD